MNQIATDTAGPAADLPMLTDAEYVAAGGNKCPHCRSTNITGGSVEVDGDGAIQEVTCGDCSRTWLDSYALQGWIAA